MASITITGDTIEMGNIPRVAGWLYFFPMSDWWTSARKPLTASSPNGGTPYMRVALTPTEDDPTIFTYASFVIPSTEDATINSSGARWGAYIFDDSDVPRLISHVAYLESFRIPSSPTTHNLQDIAGYNSSTDPPITSGDRVITGTLYGVDAEFSGTVTATQFVGGGAGLTGVTGATGGVSNTGSTTIAADTDVDGVGIISLQTRTIERVQIANDGALNALFAFNATGLSTLAGGAQLNATQAKWSTGNIAAPSTSDQNAGSRLILYPAASGEHFAMGIETGAMWFNSALASAYRFYFGAVATERLQFNANGMQVDTANALYTLNFNSTFAGDSVVRVDAPFALQFALGGTVFWEMVEDAFRPATDNVYNIGEVDKRVAEIYATKLFQGDGTAGGTFQAGYIGIPQNSKSAAYTLVLADAGKHILHPSADTTARIFTIPANASVAFPIGTAITIINQPSAGIITLAITSDVLTLYPGGTTGSRTLAAGNMCTIVKVTATSWTVTGTSGLT